MNPYPTLSQLRAEADALARDEANLLALRTLERIFARALHDARVSVWDRSAPHHPDCRYRVGDAFDDVEAVLLNLRGEARRIQAAPCVVEVA